MVQDRGTQIFMQGPGLLPSCFFYHARAVQDGQLPRPHCTQQDRSTRVKGEKGMDLPPKNMLYK